jgi:hypothetical protein
MVSIKKVKKNIKIMNLTEHCTAAWRGWGGALGV